MLWLTPGLESEMCGKVKVELIFLLMVKYPALTDGVSRFIDKILFRSKYMNTFTRSSIELISPGVYSGNSRPTTRCFLFFGFGFHAAIESLYFYCKASLKYIRTIFRNLFYEDSIRQSSTSYKLSKNNISYIIIYITFCEYVKNKQFDCR